MKTTIETIRHIGDNENSIQSDITEFIKMEELN